MNESAESIERALIPYHDAIAYTCLRSLARADVRAVVASETGGMPAAASRLCDETATLPRPKEDLLAYRDALLDVAKRPDVRTVVPVRPEDGYVLSRYRDELASHVSVVAPPFETLKTAHDRLRLAEVAEDAGVPVPETRTLDEVDDWRPEMIVKSRYNVLTTEYVDSYVRGESDVVKDVRYLKPGQEPDRDEIVGAMNHVPIVQEYVPKAGEYVFAALYDHGEPVATFQHRQIRGTSYTGGGGVYRKSVKIPELAEVGRRLLDHLHWHGLACVEYMQDANTDEYVLTEINPRMWQSLPTAVRAGADFPYYYWLLATGRASEIDPGYDVGVGSHLLQGEIGHLLRIVREDSPLVPRPSVTATAFRMIASCIVDPHFDYFRLSDPGPFVRGVLAKTSFGGLGGFVGTRSSGRPDEGEDPRVDRTG